MNATGEITRNHAKNLKVIQWNINGVSGKREYIRLLLENYEPDLVFLSETKWKTVVEANAELACGEVYRVVQIPSSVTNRGGVIAIWKAELDLVTAEKLRIDEGNDFAQAIDLTDKEEKAYVGWYNSPAMSRKAFNETLERIQTEYDVQRTLGDFNARHPRWCTQNDGKRRGTQLLHFIRKYP